MFVLICKPCLYIIDFYFYVIKTKNKNGINTNISFMYSPIRISLKKTFSLYKSDFV